MSAAPSSTPVFLDEAEARSRRNVKWGMYPADVIPAWVADLDVRPPEEAARVLHEFAAGGGWGYPFGTDRVLGSAFARRMARKHNWDVDPAHTVETSDLLQAIHACVMAFTEEGDEIISLAPTYAPFHEIPTSLGRVATQVPLRRTTGTYDLDMEALEKATTPRSRMIILCNPHNPTGKVFDRSELELLAAYVSRHDLIVISDEILSDFVFSAEPHIPTGSINGLAERTLTLAAPTKAFGITGIRCSLVHFGSPELRETFDSRVSATLMSVPGILATHVGAAVWDESDSWLDAVLQQVAANRARTNEVVTTSAPKLGISMEEGTFFAWIDCTHFEPTENGSLVRDFVMERGNIAVSDGSEYGPAYANHIRVNLGTSAELLERILEGLVAAFDDVEQLTGGSA